MPGLLTWEIVGLAALGTLLIGVWLNWRRQWDVAEIEEDVKNGKITTDQAWRRTRLVHRRATAVVIFGIGLVLVFVVGLGM